MFHKIVTKYQKIHHIWRLIQLHCCFNADKVNMQQLQRCGNNDWLHWGFGMNAFMLDTWLTAANCPLHLRSQAQPPELVIQQAQCPVLAFGSSITVTSIHGNYPVSLGDHELQNLIQFACGEVVMVKGSLVEH